jgi:hypothetical protein
LHIWRFISLHCKWVHTFYKNILKFFVILLWHFSKVHSFLFFHNFFKTFLHVKKWKRQKKVNACKLESFQLSRDILWQLERAKKRWECQVETVIFFFCRRSLQHVRYSFHSSSVSFLIFFVYFVVEWNFLTFPDFLLWRNCEK